MRNLAGAFFAVLVFLPTGGLAQWSNEPSDATIAIDCNFNHATCNGQLLDVYNGSGTRPSPPSAGTATVVQDASATISPQNVLQSTRFANNPAGGIQYELWNIPQGAKEIYSGLLWKPSVPFKGKNHNFNKLFFIRGKAPGTNGYVFLNKTYGNDPSITGLIGWNTQLAYNLNQCGGYAPDQDVCFPNIYTTPIVMGQWYKIEFRIRASSCPTCRDGRVRWWVNNQLNGDYTNFAYGPAVDFWLWSETWDGSGPPNEWETEAWHRIDHVRVSYCMNGCSGSGGGGTTPPPPGDTTPPGQVTSVTVTQLD